MDMKMTSDDGYFVEERSAETVIARMRDCDDPRLKEDHGGRDPQAA